MNFKVSVAHLSIFLGVSHVFQAAHGEYVTMHSAADPKLKLYEPPETASVTTHAGAIEFCENRGRRLADALEWCRFPSAKIWSSMVIFTGLFDTEEWTPVKGHWGNEYILVGKLGGTDPNHACQYYHGATGGTNSPTVAPAPTPPPMMSNAVTGVSTSPAICSKPPGCITSKCPVQCGNGAREAEYPDPTDCHAHCHCSNMQGESYWKREQEPEIWNPYCRDSKPLDRAHIPLGGMTGGCAAESYYVDDLSYCNATAPVPGHRALGATPAWAQGPEWGKNPDKHPGESNYILCAKNALPHPPAPPTCADIWGDPHVVTFDGLHYDCQGEGDFVLARSLDTGFEVHGRFERMKPLPNVPATVMTAAVIQTGRQGEPTVEVRGCRPDFYIDGVKAAPDIRLRQNGTMAFLTDGVHYYNQGKGVRSLYFPNSGVTVTIKSKRSTKMGCYLELKICLPEDIKNERLVGLFGTPNGNRGDEWMDPTGKPIDHTNKTLWGPSYNYATTNWCIRDPKKDMFMSPVTGKCDKPYDPSMERQVKSPPPELVAICGTDTECLTEGTAGGVPASKESVTSKRNLGPLPQPPTPAPAPTARPDTPAPTARPDTPSPTIDKTPKNKTPKKAKSHGDPHVVTWSGGKFDFHGGCDLVLVKNPGFANGLGMHIHIRTKIKTWWSYIETAAIHIGDHTLEVMGGKEGGDYWINGILGDHEKELQTHEEYLLSIAGYKVTYRRPTEKQRMYRVDLGNGDSISVVTYKHFVEVNLKASDPATFENAVGLMGAYPSGAMRGRDGQTTFEDPVAFGMEWQVIDSELMVFHNLDGVQHPEKCEMPSEDASTNRRRLGEALVSKMDAELACARVDEEDRDSCIFDVLATNDKDMAGSY